MKTRIPFCSVRVDAIRGGEPPAGRLRRSLANASASLRVVAGLVHHSGAHHPAPACASTPSALNGVNSVGSMRPVA
ncbi:hypothetical protein OG321_36445 [Streptomyces sp. NBC_00424]|uniref:hypothetical protein n=1 Tax=Streptomyces sp. NBC_00424 TaxID=2903648 RepID=UPI002252367C|nr:hypothetical protein [Streptomyces sp. NBC_00424]MCX5077943.1 hypothetical protein [Streptomyces sp. NBC_00424]